MPDDETQRDDGGPPPMDEPKVREALTEALSGQAASVLAMALLAGSLTGIAGVAVRARLREFVRRELEDTVLLTEKLSALGGGEVTATLTVTAPPADVREALGELVTRECDVVAALHAVIPHSGQEPRSEALEHLLEHVIMRKQEQVDELKAALS